MTVALGALPFLLLWFVLPLRRRAQLDEEESAEPGEADRP